jgi:iron complex transport system ATP-binding protein
MSETPLLSLQSLRAAYDAREVLHGLDLAVGAGEMVGLLGPNGSGKSTLLRVIAGLRGPSGGTVTLQGRNLAHTSGRERARRVALVPQSVSLPFAFPVFDVVAMGRHPHMALLGAPSKHDFAAIHTALEQTDCLELQERLVTELSGGELQRVIVARALAQEPELLLLDEPTAHLDLNHQLDIARLLQQLNRQRGLTVLWVSHDVNLAAEFCGRLVMLQAGALVADGPPGAVVTSEMVERVYGVRVPVGENPVSGRPQVILSAAGSESP